MGVHQNVARYPNPLTVVPVHASLMQALHSIMQ